MERTPEAYTRGILAATLEPWIDGLEKVNSALQTDVKLRSQVEDPSVEPLTKGALLAPLLSSSSPEIGNFINVLLANNDLGYLDEILALLSTVIQEEAGGPQRVLVTSAVPLTDDEQERLRTRLVQQFGSNLQFVFQVDPEILGGLVVQVGDKLIDDSVRSRLGALSQSLGVRSS
ncbi:MAG TPA: ATP synthase F1 subunit delta [Caldilineae bacterium]|nr:ATP synthase F1 subunit delta [Caldilineae bacterium]